MLAFKRDSTISAEANKLLDKYLPRWTLERVE
jgi:hypothetical protein